MREIKFRAWKKRFKTMDFGGGDLLLRINNDDFEEPQQYTGLKDKNGKDIYEGDIIKDYEGKLSQVIWLDDNSKFWIKRLNWKQNGEDTWHIITFSGEVIGNIFENPELLTN